MKPYPPIPRGVRKGTHVYVFDKLDGSNVRVEWTRKNGFNKFGRRNGLLDDSHAMLKREVPDLIRDKYGDLLEEIFRKQRWQKVTSYFEFHGPNSFAGYHEDEEHTVTLLDASVHRQGFLEPREFLKVFRYVDLPKLLHQGNFTADLKQAISDGTLEGMTFEGVVAKGPCVSPGLPLMFKWKNLAWLQRLRCDCKSEAEYERRR